MTADNGMDTSPSWQELSRQNAELSEKLEAAYRSLGISSDAIAQLQVENDDIAANAHWLSDIIRSHLSHLPEAREALDASPGKSIARLKAVTLVMAARRFPNMLRKMWSGGEVSRWLLDQAEEHSHE